MDHPLIDLISQRIADAEKDGAFDNLPGAGQPLDLTRDPAEEMMRRALAEGGVKAPVVTLKDEIEAIRVRLAGLADPGARRAEMQKLSDLQTRLAMELESLRRHR